MTYVRRDGTSVYYDNNEVNEYVKIGTPLPGSPNIVHDDTGNLTSDENGYGYAYDHDNRLTTIFHDDGASSGTAADGVQNGGEATLASYAYDALGRRIEKIDYVTGGATTTTRYYYDGHNVVAEFDAAGPAVLQRYFIHGTTYIDERAVMRDAVGGADYYYFLKDLYTVEGLVNGKLHEVERYTYDAYGKPSITIVPVWDLDYNGVTNSGDRGHVTANYGDPADKGPIYDFDGDGTIDSTDRDLVNPHFGKNLTASKVSGIDNPYLFTGRDLDVLFNGPGDSGDDHDFRIQYNRARYYDPENGRWLQRDPLEYVDGMNLYEYVASGPTNWQDPGGMRRISAQFAAFIHQRHGEWLDEPGGFRWEFQGDNRVAGGDITASRLLSEGWVESTLLGTLATQFVDFDHNTTVGASHRRRLKNNGRLLGSIGIYETATAVNDGSESMSNAWCSSTLTFTAASAYPFVWVSPDIDYSVQFVFTAVARNKVLVQMSAWHDGFPDYEGRVDGRVVYHHATPFKGPSLAAPNLGGAGDTAGSAAVLIDAETPPYCCLPDEIPAWVYRALCPDCPVIDDPTND